MSGSLALLGVLAMGGLVVGLARTELGRWPFRAPKSRAFGFGLAEPPHSFDAPVYATNAEGVITHWNQSASELLGLTAAEVVGLDARTLVPLVLRADETAALERVARGHGVQTLASVRVTREGAQVAVTVTILPLAGADGRVHGATFVLGA